MWLPTIERNGGRKKTAFDIGKDCANQKLKFAWDTITAKHLRIGEKIGVITVTIVTKTYQCFTYLATKPCQFYQF